MSFDLDAIRKIDEALILVRAEALRALAKYQPFNSAYEGYAVMQGEADSLWEGVKANQLDAARANAVRVGAMAIRFLVDVYDTKKGEEVGEALKGPADRPEHQGA